MELSQKLKELRKKQGLTQLELAERLFVSRQAISGWEAGTSRPSTENLQSLSRLFNIPLETLLDDTAEAEPAAAPEKKHPECTTLKSAKKYANEWLQTRVDQGLSAWTVQLEAKALGKLYGISPDDENYFNPPKRKREEIKRSRGDRVRDKHFSKTNNDELIKFCRGTGLRRKELQELRGKDLVSRAQIEAEISELQKIPEEQRAPSVTKRLEMLQDARLFSEEWFIHVRNGKGGRERLSPIIGKNAGQIIERIADTPAEEKVWQHIHNCADIHGYRAEYATAIYKAHARAIEEIPYDRVNRGTGRRYQSEVYTCRKDEAGKKLDKAAMLICSKALGHNRISVVADNYIRGL